MKLADVPPAPAYLVCHDHYGHGAMDVWAAETIAEAQDEANKRNQALDDQGVDGCHWAAYEKLPRLKIFKFHPSRAA